MPTIDFLLSALRDAVAAKRLFRKALSDPSHPHPRVINTDQARLYGSANSGVKKEGILRRGCRHRPIQYLNDILEQDHSAIKRRVKAKQGFREFHAARRTIQGYEAIHMIRKGQARRVSGSDVRRQIQFINKLFGVAARDGARSTRPIALLPLFESCNTSYLGLQIVYKRRPSAHLSGLRGLALDRRTSRAAPDRIRLPA